MHLGVKCGLASMFKDGEVKPLIIIIKLGFFLSIFIIFDIVDKELRL